MHTKMYNNNTVWAQSQILLLEHDQIEFELLINVFGPI